MNNLILLENNGPIKIYQTDKGENVVNARELHQGLHNKRQFADWIKQRLNEVDAVENNDYISLSQKCEGNNATKIEYILKLDIAKEMAMLERNEKGKNYRRYFIEVEKKYKQSLPKLSKELQAIFQLDNKQQQFETRLDNLENNTTIDFGQQRNLQVLAQKTVLRIIGGKETPAYKDKPIRSKVFSSLWKDYKDYMQVASYRDTLKIDYNRAVTYITNWRLNGKLLREVEECNAQIELVI